ncbi:MAG: cyclodeaminase/cyclohydrolase family protein [Trebonia sp.]
MRDDTINDYLDKLAERTAAPAGGATAALNAAQAAALLAMSARYCDGPVHAERREMIERVVTEAEQLRHACIALMVADGESYHGVMAAYQLAKETAEQRTARAAAIAAALATAAGPPAEVIGAAARLLDMAQSLQPIVNRSIAPDVAAAVEAIRAAIGVSRTNIEANLAGMTDPTARDRLTRVIADVPALEATAGQVIAAVRARYA